MSFVDSASTVTVQAFLTTNGRAKLLAGIQGDIDSFITKFALGDSDCNYAAIDAGYGALPSGFVPSPGEKLSRIRSYVLAAGQFRPGNPGILVDGKHASTEGHYVQFQASESAGREQRWKVETQWPRGAGYDEGYDAESSLVDTLGPNVPGFQAGFYRSVFLSNFDWSFDEATSELVFSQTGDLASSWLDRFVGPGTGANTGWSVEFRLEGSDTGAVTRVVIDLVR